MHHTRQMLGYSYAASSKKLGAPDQLKGAAGIAPLPGPSQCSAGCPPRRKPGAPSIAKCVGENNGSGIGALLPQQVLWALLGWHSWPTAGLLAATRAGAQLDGGWRVSKRNGCAGRSRRSSNLRHSHQHGISTGILEYWKVAVDVATVITCFAKTFEGDQSARAPGFPAKCSKANSLTAMPRLKNRLLI
jgi:hypothetical protein